ncbi:ribosomal L1 domain-containing protein 1 [Gastrophryne carolinensis]
MEERQEHGVDSAQVKKAVQALFAYHKSKENGNKLLLNENDRISLMITVWKIPNRPQVLRIPLPHGIRPETCEVCLFTRDEPDMSSDQTEKFYKKLLAQNGITHINEIIPYKRLKTEYKPFEAKRRLLSSFDLFLADSRIRRLLPSHIGKHFYKEKREPQSVNLKAKRLSYELNRFIQGTQLHITNKGCCYSIRVGHTGMKVEEIVENTLAVAEVLAEKLPMKWKNVKLLHLKTQKSVSLPVYNSSLDIMQELSLTKNKPVKLKENKKKARKQNKRTASKNKNKISKAQSPNSEEQESAPKSAIPKKTPKMSGKATAKLTKSARKAPQTPKLKQKKLLRVPKSV